jgi:hypothetical protein
VSSFQVQVLDIGTGRLGYPQAVEGKQGDRGVRGERTEPDGDQDGAQPVAVESGGVLLIVESRAADVRGRGVLEQFFFLDGVLIELRDGAQPPGDGGTGLAQASNSRAKVSMSARQTANSGRDRALHQAVNCRRSSM